MRQVSNAQQLIRTTILDDIVIAHLHLKSPRRRVRVLLDVGHSGDDQVDCPPAVGAVIPDIPNAKLAAGERVPGLVGDAIWDTDAWAGWVAGPAWTGSWGVRGASRILPVECNGAGLFAEPKSNCGQWEQSLSEADR